MIFSLQPAGVFASTLISTRTMPKRPVLSNYPHLHNLLRNDPVANREFNACLTEVNAPTRAEAPSSALETALDAQTKLILEVTELKTQAVKMRRFIDILGAVIEPQVHLRPYIQDAAVQGTYDIKFSSNQLRMALRLYWDSVAQRMEDKVELNSPKEVADEET